MALRAQKFRQNTSAPETVDRICQQGGALPRRECRRQHSQQGDRGDDDEDVARDRRHRVSKKHQHRADKDHQNDGQVVDQIIDDKRRYAVDQWHALSQQCNLYRFAQQGTGESKEAHGFAAEACGEGLH